LSAIGNQEFPKGDLFSWYLDAWDDNVEKIIRQMVSCLDEYDPKTLSVDPVESRDLQEKPVPATLLCTSLHWKRTLRYWKLSVNCLAQFARGVSLRHSFSLAEIPHIPARSS
jgi:hypothetical protein